MMSLLMFMWMMVMMRMVIVVAMMIPMDSGPQLVVAELSTKEDRDIYLIQVGLLARS